jgi:GNAT superfamily N-acetyltransferase
VDIARASQADVDWLVRHDPHVSEAWIRRCVAHGEYFVAQDADGYRGFLRFSRFWGRIPYMEMIRVPPAYQRCGVGTSLFLAWQEAMRGEGATLLMTSSEDDEPEPQSWHRRNGFADAGALALPSIQSAAEVFFVKPIG